MEIILIWIGFAVVTAIAAGSRGRNWFGWLLLGFLFTLFALITVLVLPAKNKQDANTAQPRPPHERGTPQQKEDTRAARRSAARRTARRFPELAGTGDYDQMVVGTSKYQQHLIALANPLSDYSQHVKIPAVLALEDDNPFDPNAVAIHLGDQLAGYLPREDAVEFREDLAALDTDQTRFHVRALIIGGDGNKSLGLRLDLDWPIRLKE